MLISQCQYQRLKIPFLPDLSQYTLDQLSHTSVTMRQAAERLMVQLLLKTSVASTLIDHFFNHLFTTLSSKEMKQREQAAVHLGLIVLGRPKMTLKRLSYFSRVTAQPDPLHIALLEKLLLSQPTEVHSFSPVFLGLLCSPS